MNIFSLVPCMVPSSFVAACQGGSLRIQEELLPVFLPSSQWLC